MESEQNTESHETRQKTEGQTSSPAMASHGWSRSRNTLPFYKDKMTGMFKCHLCSYETIHRGSLRSHFAVHTDTRPYACDMCSYEAKRLNDLKKHKVLKHGKSLGSLRVKKRPGLTQIKQEFPTRSLRPAVPNMDSENSNFASSQDYHQQPTGDGLSDLDYPDCHGENCEPLVRRDAVPDPNAPVFPEQMVGPSTETERDHVEEQIQHYEEHEEGSGHDDNANSCSDFVMVKPEPPDEDYDASGNHHGDDAYCEVSGYGPEREDGSAHGSGDNQFSDAIAMLEMCMDTSLEAPEQKEDGYGQGTSSCVLQRRNVSGSSIMSSMIPHNTQRARSSDSGHSSIASSYSPSTGSGNGNASSSYSRSKSANAASYNRPSRSSSFGSAHDEQLQNNTANTEKAWHCVYCNIMFFDGAIYCMHMGLHNQDDPWECSMCGRKYHDVYGFTSHFVNGHG